VPDPDAPDVPDRVVDTRPGRLGGAGGLARLGAACARHPLVVIGVWLLAVVGLGVARATHGGVFSDNVDLPHTQSHTGAALLSAHEPGASGYSGYVVFHTTSGPLSQQSAAVQASVTNLEALPHVLAVSDPLHAPAGAPLTAAAQATGRATVQFDVRPKTLGSTYVAQLDTATHPARAAGVQVEYGGGLDELTRPPASDRRAEAIGLGVALVVLLVGFGSVLAALLPLVTALVCVLVGVSLLSLVAAVVSFGTASPTLALMVGLGVGIDYALFLTTRFRQLVTDREDPVSAAARTASTSGYAVLTAAAIVAVALLGLYASGITFIGQLGLAAVFTVVTAAAGALTLVPAGLGLAGRRIDRWRVRTPVAESGSAHDSWHRYAESVTAHPWRCLAGGLVLLAVLTVPLLSLRLGHVDDGADPSSFTDKRAYDLIAAAYGPGANGPFTVVVDVAHATEPVATIATRVQSDLAGVPGVASMSPLQPSSDGAILVGTLVATTAPQDAATTALFHTVVDTTLPHALAGTGASGYVTGTAASLIDFATSLAGRLPLIIAVVVATAFLLVMTAFRSLWLAVKAAVLNLLSVGAAYGVVVAVFQWGWGSGLLGLSQRVPIESYVPMMMFAIVFGLSMDYEIFLLSRVKEAYGHLGDTRAAVVAGLAGTGRVITCAALIMVSVFTSFVASPDVVIKMLAVGLSASVLIDASIVRLLLVPATMTLLDRANWWLPAWLDRLLPRIRLEGEEAAVVDSPQVAVG